MGGREYRIDRNGQLEYSSITGLPPASTSRNVRVPDYIWAAAKDAAAVRGETLSSVMVAALLAYAQEHAGELATRPAVAGEQPLF
ncbi:MAG: hypothetical protein HOV96_19575 [Nonomuraea sp.]|nr:hypothetical protein [Nonomuraea sp.]